MWKKMATSVLLVSVLALLSVGLGCSSDGSGAPSIANVDADDVSAVSATIVWTTNEKASSQVEYGVSENYGSQSPLDSELVKSHAVILTQLAPSTTYYYRVISVDGAGNEVKSSGWSFETRMQFNVTGSQLTSENGTATLRVMYNTSAPVTFSLANPDGIETGTDSPETGATSASLAMADQYETPKSGMYKLTVETPQQEALTQDFDFTGASATITEVTPSFVPYGLPNQYLLQGLSIRVKNAGDLPACINGGEFYLDGGNAFKFSTNQIILPGETKLFSVSTSVSGVTDSPKQLSVMLRDSKYAEIATYAATVYP